MTTSLMTCNNHACPILCRVCPGRFVGENSVWLAIASFLAAFNLEPATDATGAPIDPKLEVLPGFASYVDLHAIT
jgi:hypothetical protein